MSYKREDVEKVYDAIHSGKTLDRPTPDEAAILFYANKLEKHDFCNAVAKGEFPAVALTSEEMQQLKGGNLAAFASAFQRVIKALL